MLTPNGQVTFAGWIAEHLSGCELYVTDGTSTATSPAQTRVDGAVVTLHAVFAEADANFEWRRRGVLAAGELLDVADGDFGRKPAGAIWTLEVPIELGAE